MQPLEHIDTIVIVMMENRSFDHLLGYLSLPEFGRSDVDGLRPGMKNTVGTTGYPIFHLPSGRNQLPADPLHERKNITMQLFGDATNDGCIQVPPSLGAPYSMNGFVKSYFTTNGVDKSQPPIVMGYHTADDLPATSFFANQYCICDRWFASIPTGTQPNRLMAMSGYSVNDVNQQLTLPKQHLVYDWLTERKIRWRVYHQGIPFFMLMEGWHLRILVDDNFCDLDDFQDDIMTESDETYPQVIFMEPRYGDAPHIEAPTDDHPPTPIINGQNFLLKVYSTLLANPDRWSRTLMIVTYDENGGFFDHVSPLAVTTNPPMGSNYPPFLSTGPRVPGIIISPFVEPGSVYHENLDHTSILKLLGEKFNNGSYSPEVDKRTLDNLANVITRSTPRTDMPMAAGIGQTPDKPAAEPTPLAFKDAITDAKYVNPVATMNKFPELFTHFDNLEPKLRS
jgi:phospholipase C